MDMEKDSWLAYIGNIEDGRENLGSEMPVAVYRLFEFTMKEVLVESFGIEKANALFRKAGEYAGIRFAKEMLDPTMEFNQFIADLQKRLKELKIGLFRLEQVDEDASSLTIAIGEDLDCSGLPISGEAVCNYDEGFLRGVLKAYTGKDYNVVEIDCWANGGRVCRFKATSIKDM